MIQHFISPPNEINKFIKNVKKIINADTFDPKKHFILAKRKNDFSNTIYSNQNTLLYLNYNHNDVINEINQLTISDYYETIMDVVGNECLLYVFKKKIKGEDIYIKLTIKNDKIIFCISFHISS